MVSIFVNPKQFGPREDLSKYPRPFAKDRALCVREGADLLFHPTVGDMYMGDASVSISEQSLSSGLCGASRPGHFDGVCTVVGMLFNITRPDIAVFGEKDWQQLAVIRRLVRDLKFPVKIVGCPTVREEDGLALSSRNVLLSVDSRRMAPRIYQALQGAAMEAEEGGSPASVKRRLRLELSSIPGAEIDYVEIMDEARLVPVSKTTPVGKVRALVAVRFGPVRLIDNLPLRFSR